MKILNERTAHPSTSVRFGCKMLAYMAPSQYDGQDEFIKSCLSSGGNSLKRQGQLPFGTIGNEHERVNPDFGKNEFLANKSPFQIGWGIAILNRAEKMDMRCLKVPNPAVLDPQFDTTIATVSNLRPLTLMAHLRQSFQLDRNPSDPHPFKFGNWTLMHVGALPSHAVRELKVMLEKANQEDPLVPLPKGTTDSELMACYLAYKMLKKTGKIDTTEVDTQTVQTIFKEAVSDISLWPGTLNQEDLQKSLENGGQGLLRHSPNMFVWSDGERLLASSATNRAGAMYIGVHESASREQEYLLANQKLQPLPNKNLGRIQWEELPDHAVTVLTREKSDDGTTQIQRKQEKLPRRPYKKWQNLVDTFRFLRFALFNRLKVMINSG